MTKLFVQPGNVLDHSPAAAVASGAVVVIGARVGVALADIAANATGSLQVTGVFQLPKKAADTIAQGALVYWDATNSQITTTASGNTLAGFAANAAAASVTSVNVKING
jgi:predicted RecA/RadA family phage recombinase